MLLFYVTHASREAAKEVCDALLREHLIACYNLLPIESAYWWRSELANEQEVVSLLKTRPELAARVEEAVMRLHPYDLPCIMRWEVAANAEYERWIAEETS